jgi:hypothetical protein
MNSAASTSATASPPRMSIVHGSGLGLTMPALRKVQKISTRRHLRKRSWVRMPATFSMTITSGSSKTTPNPSSIPVK